MSEHPPGLMGTARATIDDLGKLFKRMPVSCLVLAQDLSICAATEDYLKATLTTERDILGRHMFDAFPDNPDDPEATGVRNLSASFDRVRATGARHAMGLQRYDIPTPNGGFEERHWLPINAPIFHEGRLLWIVHRVEDVTDYVRLKQSLEDPEEPARLLDEDIRRVEAGMFSLTRELQAELAAAVQANEAKMQFLAAVSHDIRQPLEAANLYTQYLTGFDLPEKARESVERLQGSLASANSMLTNLLDLSRIASGKIAPQVEVFWLPDLLAKLVNEFSPLAVASGLGFKASPCFHAARSDPLLLEQILRNLIGNAIKYTGKGTVAVACSRAGQEIKISVRDTGSGIPADKVEEIFEDYFQLGNPSRAKGLGLGLAIVARIAKLLGHRVTVHSRLHKGSIFSIYVPASDTRPVSPIA